MFDASDRSLLKQQLFRFRWLLWCFLPSLVLVWVLFLVLAVLPEHWIQRMDSSLPNWELWGFGGFMFLAVLLSFFVNGIIVFKALGERFRLSPLPRAVLTTAVFLVVFPALDELLDSPFKRLMRWVQSNMDGVLASNQTTLETLISGAMVVSVQFLSLLAMIAVYPLALVLLMAVSKRPSHQPSETLP